MTAHQLPRRLPHRPLYLYLLVPFLLALVTLLADDSSAQTDSGAVILQYHHISTATPPVSSISPEDFRRHMDYLRDGGFTVLPLEEVLAAVRDGESLPDRTVALTFDDGYRSVYEEAFPIMKANDWPFTIFVTAGLVDSNSRLYSSWDQLREMGEQGATLANHTMTHPYFLERGNNESRGDWLDRIRGEILEAEDIIEDETGQRHQLIAYPYGEYNPDIQSLIEDLGFIGLSQHSGPINSTSDFTALPRFPFSGIYVGMDSYRNKVNSLAFNVEHQEPASPVTDQRSPEAEIRFGPGPYRLTQLSCFNNNEAIEVSVEDDSVHISTHVENRGRRFRYNCTAPGPDGRFFWHSVHWVNPSIPE